MTCNRRLLPALAAFLVPAVAAAHPSRGIVATANGQVFFSDLQRVWTVDPRGRLSMIRGPNGGHTHELFLAPDGTLYGEDSHYNDGRYSASLWRRDVSGRLTFLFGPASNPPAGLGVVRDGRGCTYQSDRAGNGALVLYRRCGSRSSRLAGATASPRDLLSNISGATMGPGGFYFRRGSTVRRVDAAGRMAIAASGLSAENFGLGVGPDGSVYAAEYSRRRIVRVEPNGRRSVVVASPAPWSPTGVAVVGRSLFVLEATSGGNKGMRVRRINGARSRVIAVVP